MSNMNVYQRLASGDEQNLPSASSDGSIMEETIIINPLAGRLELSKNSEFKSKTTEEWINIFPNAAYFSGYDEDLFGHVVVMVYENTVTEKICSVSLTKFGVTIYQDLILNQDSRFYPAVENLLPIHKESKVRKALAITNLKNYNKLVNHPGNFQIEKRWDETNAGTLASNMNLLVDKRPNEFGIKLLQMGLIQDHYLKSTVLDVVYNNNSKSPDMMEKNNKLVCLLGDQLDQLFDPLLEYSPETLETSYNVPNAATYEHPKLANNEKIESILTELFSIQTNFTMGLVGLLQSFIIPLRVQILESSNSHGIIKINHIFPPTIDEITRINCVLHDSLSKARSFGYVEIIKVLGMILPYFYKPFIRHEANLRNFKSRFNKFYSKYENKVFNDTNVNKSNFSKNYIDSVITGSLLELPRLKLILTRLKEAIEEGLHKLPDSESTRDELHNINYYCQTAFDIIDAFGGEGEGAKDHQRANSQQRIFTPTGKLLTELATNWPAELQYGWLSRKVVGIFELKNVKPSNVNYYDDEVLIIFSDTVLFLRIVDDNYYIKNNSNTNIRISDVLMHSLVNEKPLPKLTLFPQMEVSHWSPINDVSVTTYKSFSFLTSSEENFLRFFDHTGNGFKGEEQQELCKTYEILRDSHSVQFTTGNEIIELINKAKVLHKNQPFHLFRSNKSDLHVYSTAHTAVGYDQERTKSQLLLLLNMGDEMISYYFGKNKHLFFIVTANFTYDGNVQLIGFNRSKRPELNVIVPEHEFQGSLLNVLNEYTNCYFNSFTPMTELMIKSNNSDLEYFLFNYQRFNGFEVREMMKSRAGSMKIKNTKEASPPPNTTTDESVSRDIEGPLLANVGNSAEAKMKAAKKPRRRSFLSKLFRLKKSKPEPVDREEQSREYKKLYKPVPELEKVEVPPARYEDDGEDLATVQYFNVDNTEQNEQQQVGPIKQEIPNQKPVNHSYSGTEPQQSEPEPVVNLQPAEPPNKIPATLAPLMKPTELKIRKVVPNSMNQAPKQATPHSAYPTSQAQHPNIPNVKPQYPAHRPFKELYSSDDSLGKPLGFIRTVPEPVPTETKPAVSVTPSGPVNEVYKESRSPSVEVKSKFEFPSPTKSIFEGDNHDNDRIINKKPSTALSIKSINEDSLKLTSSIRDFYAYDDPQEANWIQFSRESSVTSIPQTMEQKVRQLKYPPQPLRNASMNSVDSSFTRDANFANNVRDVSAADSFRSQIIFFNEKVASNVRDVESESQTSSQFVNEFSKEIDQNFSSSRNALRTLDAHEFETNRASTLNGDTTLRRSSAGYNWTNNEIDPTTSEEEYYSIEDNCSFPRSPRVEKVLSASPITPKTPLTPHNATNGSFSSENTIINELLDHKVAPLQREDTLKTLNNNIYLGQFDSMAYLSDILNGTVDFDLE